LANKYFQPVDFVNDYKKLFELRWSQFVYRFADWQPILYNWCYIEKCNEL